MPLRAVVDGADVFAPDLDDRAWSALRRDMGFGLRDVQLPCCAGLVGLRASSLGLKHFYHRSSPAGCDWLPESPEHMRIKWAVLLAARSCGWSVQAEARGLDWRADMLAELGGRRVAFEVQLSGQSWAVTRERHLKYERDGIECCWLLGPRVSVPSDGYGYQFMELPFLWRVSECEGTWGVFKYHDFRARERPLDKFVSFFLSSQGPAPSIASYVPFTSAMLRERKRLERLGRDGRGACFVTCTVCGSAEVYSYTGGPRTCVKCSPGWFTPYSRP